MTRIILTGAEMDKMAEEDRARHLANITVVEKLEFDDISKKTVTIISLPDEDEYDDEI